MRRSAVTALCAFALSGSAAAQRAFVPGYLVPAAGDTTQVDLLDRDARVSPRELTYRTSAVAAPVSAPVTEFLAFGYRDGERFETHEVPLDRASDRPRALTTYREARPTPEVLALRIVAGGSTTLYRYDEQGLTRFFARLPGAAAGSAPEPLVYKRFRTATNELRENRAFAQRLSQALACPGIPPARFASVAYSERSLLRLLSEYEGACGAGETAVATVAEPRKRVGIEVSPRVGLSRCYLEADRTGLAADEDYGAEPGFRVGVEVALVMPSRFGRLAVTFEPTYELLAADNLDEATLGFAPAGETSGYVLDYDAVSVPVGVRYALLRRGPWQVDVYGGMVISLRARKDLQFRTRAYRTKVLDHAAAVGVRVGYKRWSAELRPQFGGEYVLQTPPVAFTQRRASVILGYRAYRLCPRG